MINDAAKNGQCDNTSAQAPCCKITKQGAVANMASFLIFPQFSLLMHVCRPSFGAV